MEVVFHRLAWSTQLSSPKSCFTLREDSWDDYSFKTMYRVVYYDDTGESFHVGEVKIGYVGQSSGWTSQGLPETFEVLSPEFFSVGQSTEYYENMRGLPGFKIAWLKSLGDLAALPERRKIAYDQKVFVDSLTRTVSVAIIEQQFSRIVRGLAALTAYNFEFIRSAGEKLAGVRLPFQVGPDSRPPSNIHVLIGRNGVGKTRILNGMVAGALGDASERSESGYFADRSYPSLPQIDDKYFSGIVSVSFSAFDPFQPPPNKLERDAGIRYTYIGLKDNKSSAAASILRDMNSLGEEFFESLRTCLSQSKKRAQWLESISILESDPNFAEMSLSDLQHVTDSDKGRVVSQFKSRMSSGHAIVLLTMTRLVESVEQKTLLLIDEPESHLHPPLLSAFTRALSHLLSSENAVAIVATHSPVLLQEVPRSCAWILSRSRLIMDAERPSVETFGENLGLLTREVFKFEVSKSGFHALLSESVAEGGSFDEIMNQYSDRIGMEGQAVLMSMIRSRDGGV